MNHCTATLCREGCKWALACLSAVALGVVVVLSRIEAGMSTDATSKGGCNDAARAACLLANLSMTAANSAALLCSICTTLRC